MISVDFQMWSLIWFLKHVFLEKKKTKTKNSFQIINSIQGEIYNF